MFSTKNDYFVYLHYTWLILLNKLLLSIDGFSFKELCCVPEDCLLNFWFLLFILVQVVFQDILYPSHANTSGNFQKILVSQFTQQCGYTQIWKSRFPKQSCLLHLSYILIYLGTPYSPQPNYSRIKHSCCFEAFLKYLFQSLIEISFI